MTLTASGIPITVSRLITKHKAEKNYETKYNTLSSGIVLSLLFSVPVVLILLFCPSLLDKIFSDKRCSEVLTIILPSVIITSCYSVIRGYFWGEKKFLTYSIIELLEEAVMLTSGIILIAHSSTAFDGAKRAGYAVTISYVFSFLMATIIYFINKGKLASPVKELPVLFNSAFPITIMRTTTSLINTLIAVILPSKLISIGLSSKEALMAFGELSGMSIPLINIPSTIIGSIALVLVPELAENFYKRKDISLKNNIEKAIKCSVFISCLIIPSFISLGREIGLLIYSNVNAGIYVSRASLIMLPMSITLISTSMLNSLNLEKKTLFYYLIGAFSLLFCINFLPKFVGVYSLILGLFLSYTITSICNLFLIKKTCKNPPNITAFLIASFIFIIPSTLLGYLLKNILIRFLPLWATICISSLIITFFIYLFFKIFDLIDIKEFVK